MKKLLSLMMLIFVGYLVYSSYQKYTAPLLRELIPNKTNTSIVQIRDITYKVEVANTNEQKAKGLAGRTSLDQNQGMLFIFPTVDFHTFWMRGMKIPLDFVWINGETIVDLTENVPPPLTETYAPPIIKPKKPVDKVLEINAGHIKANNFQINDQVRISLFKEK